MGGPAIFSNSDAVADAIRVCQAMPCSVAMPAGTGKTEIIAALACVAAIEQQRVLILTHTVRQYPYLAGVTAAAEPDWSNSAKYYEGAQRVAASPVLRSVLASTYSYAMIDEYQDCGLQQHSLAQAIADAVPIAVFGDPLQAIFGWDKFDPLPPWREEIQRLWPNHPVTVSPWRWKGHDEDLGQWLLSIRSHFHDERPISIGDGTPVRWLRSDGYSTAVRACRQLRADFPNDSIVAIGYREHDCRGVASRLNGSYGVMETIEGKDMLQFGQVIDRADGPELAAATAAWAKDCISGVSTAIKSTDVDRLRNGSQQLRSAGRALKLLMNTCRTCWTSRPRPSSSTPCSPLNR